MTLIKVCGITRLEDALTAAEAGANLLGFVFAPSPRSADPQVVRRISERLAKSWPEVGRVGVFVSPGGSELARLAHETSLTHLQIHGSVPSSLPPGVPWIAGVSLGSPADAARVAGAAEGAWALLVDTQDPDLDGGTGRSFPWDWAAPILARRRTILAGGLDAERVESLLGMVSPFGVDASSRLESLPGIKDPEKVRAYIRAVRRMDRAGESASGAASEPGGCPQEERPDPSGGRGA